MKKQNETKLFAFKMSEKTHATKAENQWKARDGVSTAGCTGWWARGYDRWGNENGIFC
ncbi:hypothetical protein [Kangiella koreensis]|uniref:Uncharacterized protein n=1 Tax=Kangiella koreensis (strain DSM 16069 / JCM 12317 / KCTC 12182 / SW-125) TaxID=523791 RepID=C7RCJ1_KANKD|nr:hypothetical protein [Kangiella koreensis]ACV26983.1 hypothetical protein Kkor_1571 [Kangiella koreensis DSM 16069]